MSSVIGFRASLRAGLVWVGVSSSVWAQQAPPPGAVPTPEQLRPPLQATQPAPALPEAPPVLRELGKPSDEIVLDVAGYAVDASAPEALKRALPGLTAPYTGKGRSYEDLVNAATAVTRYLQSELGLYLGYAYLPEQVPKDGIVRIGVLEGRLDQVSLVWDDKLPVKREIVEAYLARLKSGEVLRVRDIERIVFLVNDLRGLTVRFEVKAGRTPGTASLVVTALPEDRWTRRVDVDNHGSRYSGEYRVSGLAQMSSPTGRGDGLVLNALASDTGGLLFALAGYTLPVGSNGLKIGASASVVKYKLDKDELPLGLNGDAFTVTAYGLYPWVRSRNLNLFGLASLDLKRFTDKQSATGISRDRNIDELRLGVFGDWRDDWLTGGVNTYELALTTGRLEFNPPSYLADTPSSYTSLGLNLTRLQNIVSNRLLLYAALRAQIANDNLDNAAQFQLGGPDRVRAYAPGEATGDQGYVLSTELRFLPPESLAGRLARELVFSFFYDVGSIRFRHDPSRQPADFVNSTTLGGWGFGGVWDRPRDFSLRVYLSWRSQGEAVNDTKERSPRIYASFSKSL